MTIEEKAKKYESNIGSQDYVPTEIEEAFKAGAEWMLEKAINWLKSNVGKYPEINWDQQEWYSNKERLIKDFKKAMDE